MRHSTLTLTAVQAAGAAVAGVGGSATWLAVAALAAPPELAALGRMVSAGTLAASLLSAGMGQFLLLMAGRSDTASLRRYARACAAAGCGLSALVGLGLGLAQGGGLASALQGAALAAGLALVNLQDALFLAGEMPADLPLKAAALVVVRLALLLAAWALGAGAGGLALAFVLAQLLVGGGWWAARVPLALRRHAGRPATGAGGVGAWRALGFSYLYAGAVAAIAAGVPALVTARAPLAEGGTFYLGWTLAGLLGSVAAGAANAMVVAPGRASRPGRSLGALLGGLALLAAALVAGAPPAIAALRPGYAGVGAVLGPLALGQVGLGASIGALGALRARELGGGLALALLAWPALILGAVALGLGSGGAAGAAEWFAAASAVGALPLGLAALRGAPRAAGLASGGAS